MASKALVAQGKERRNQIMRYVRWYIRENGISPSMAEIAEGVGLSTRSAVIHHVEKLVEEGRLLRYEGIARAIRLP